MPSVTIVFAKKIGPNVMIVQSYAYVTFLLSSEVWVVWERWRLNSSGYLFSNLRKNKSSGVFATGN